MQSLKRAALGLMLWMMGATACAASFWFADRDGLHRLDPATNQVVQNIALAENAAAIAVDPADNAIWVITANTATKFSATGSLTFQVDLKSLAGDIGSARTAALDTLSGAVWIAGERRLLHLAPDGHLLASALAPEAVQALALAPDRSLWVLGTSTLFQYSTGAQPIGQWPLAQPLQQSRFLALDSNEGVLWVAGNKGLSKFALNQPQTVVLTIALPEVAGAVALDPLAHVLWIAGSQTLFGYGADGTLKASSDLKSHSITQSTDLAFDFVSQTLWLGHVAGLSRFSTQGAYALTVPVKTKVDALGKMLIGLPTPAVGLVSPAPGSITNNARPSLQLRYDALCGGVSCGFPNSYFSAYSLNAQLNGQDVSSLFVFDTTTDRASYLPPTRLLEGPNTIIARVTDGFGQVSDPLNATFTIDTIAPQFLSIIPPSGTVFSVPQMTLQGRVDDAQAIVAVTAPTGGSSSIGSTFSFPLTLRSGDNPVTLAATDVAGNRNSVSLTYRYQPFSVTIDAPVNGSTIDSDKVTVTGSYSGGSNVTVTVNGVAATVSGTSYTASNVPIAFGSNVLTATATSGDGATATQAITVNSTFPNIRIDSPTANASFNTDRILVTGTVNAPANSGVTVNGVVAVVSGTQFYASNVSLSTGQATVTATVTSPTGKKASQSISVSSSGPSPVQISANPIQGIAPLTVAFTVTSSGNPIVSWQANPGGPGTADTSDPSVLFKYTYTQPGTYSATVTVKDSAGVSYTQTIVIGVQSLTQMDQMFRSIWSGLNNALLAGDKAGAMAYLARTAKDKYGPVFDVLLPSMPGIIASYSPLALGSISQDIAEYAVTRPRNGATYIFFVHFLRDGDGVWRLDEM